MKKIERFILLLAIMGLMYIPIMSKLNTSTSLIKLRHSEYIVADLDIERSEEADICTYPATYEIDNESSFIIRGNYELAVNVSKETAVNISIDFVKNILPNALTLNLRSVEPHEDYWPGHPTLILDHWPRWAMTLTSDNLEAAVYVNALSGKVIQFSLYQYNKSAFSSDSIDTTEEIEDHIEAFFSQQNYTLPLDAVFDGIVRKSESRNPYYSVSFHQEKNETRINFGEIYFEVDSTHGVITQFVYKWIEIASIPINRVLPTDEIDTLIYNEFVDRSEIAIVSKTLNLDFVDYESGSASFDLHLVYLITVVRFNSNIYKIDAITGQIISIDLLLSNPFLIFSSPYVRLGITLTIAMTISSMAAMILKRRRNNI